MVNVSIAYNDNVDKFFPHITQISYIEDGITVEVADDDLPTYHFPTNTTLWLSYDNGTYAISEKGLRSIQILKE